MISIPLGVNLKGQRISNPEVKDWVKKESAFERINQDLPDLNTEKDIKAPHDNQISFVMTFYRSATIEKERLESSDLQR